MSAFDPKRTFGSERCCCCNCLLNPISPVANPCCNRVLFGVVPALVKAMRRRDFIKGISVWTALPLAAQAQQRERMRRIGVLNSLAADDPQSQRRMTAFVQGLQQFGWTDGRNVTIETRWGAGDSERLRRYAAELVALAPDVILAVTVSSMVPLQHATRTVPIVFVQVTDAV